MRVAGARRLATIALLAGVLLAGVVASSCELDDSCDDCVDIVATVPWDGPEEYTYELLRSGERVGTYTLSVEEGEGETWVLVQRYDGDEGDSDVATVTVERDTLKPIRAVREVRGEDTRRVAEATYEPVPEGECKSGVVARIEQRVYSPPDSDQPDSTRRNPLCVPEHAYENDTSLFIWRTIDFAEGYEARYNAVLTAVRNVQQVTIRVDGVVDDTPAGPVEAWRVTIEGEGSEQRAWFSTDAERRLLAYQNGDLTFLLQE